MPAANRRLAVIATPFVPKNARPGAANLDGDIIRARLPQEDVGFSMFDLDPLVDLAEQVDRVFDEHPVGRRDAVLFYAAAPVVVSVEGELFLCFDPTHPTVGDALSDLAQVFIERARCPLLFVVECRHEDEGLGVARAVEIVEAARKAVIASGGRIELLVAAAPADGAGSAFTRALVEIVGDPSLDSGSAKAVYQRLRAHPAVVGVVPAFGYVGMDPSFELVLPREAPAEPVAPPPARAVPMVIAPMPPAPMAPVVPQRTVPEHAAPASARVSGTGFVPAAGRPAAAVDDVPRVIIAPRAPVSAPVEPAQAPVAAAPALAPVVVPTPPAPAPAPAVVATPPAPASAPAPAVVAAPVAVQEPKPVEPPAPSEKVIVRHDPPPAAPPSKPAEGPSETPKPAPAAAETAPASAPKAAEEKPKPGPAKLATFEDALADGDAHARRGEDEAALASYKKCLGLLARGANAERAEVYVRIGGLKRRQEKHREAISNFEKALGVVADHRVALEGLVDLYALVGDVRNTFSAEEKLVAVLSDEDEIFTRLVAFGARWMDEAKDNLRARSVLERARGLRAKDLGMLDRLRVLYEADGDRERAFGLRREMVELLTDPRAKGAAIFAMAKDLLADPTKEDRALALCDEALDVDPSALGPLEIVAKTLAERQEWSELEAAYRRMIERAPRIENEEIRSRVRAELFRMLGLLFREHLVDPESALSAYRDALAEQPDDIHGHLTAAELAIELGQHGQAEPHLLAAIRLDPTRIGAYHDLFRVRTALGKEDRAYLTAAATELLGQATDGEHAVFTAGRPTGLLTPKNALPEDAWESLRGPSARVVGPVLEAFADAALEARVSELAAGSRLPALDPAARQDAETSTVSVVRSLGWASHFLGIEPPAVYLSEDPALSLVAVPATEPSALAGGGVLRGRSPVELAFLVGKHLAYYVGAHRLLVYFPSLEELSICFLAAVSVVRPGSPMPERYREAAESLATRAAPHLDDDARAELEAAVAAFEASGGKANLGGWVAAVERSAARAGLLLSGDLTVAAAALRADPQGLLPAEDKIADLLAFMVSDIHAELRESMGLAIG